MTLEFSRSAEARRRRSRGTRRLALAACGSGLPPASRRRASFGPVLFRHPHRPMPSPEHPYLYGGRAVPGVGARGSRSRRIDRPCRRAARPARPLIAGARELVAAVSALFPTTDLPAGVLGWRSRLPAGTACRPPRSPANAARTRWSPVRPTATVAPILGCTAPGRRRAGILSAQAPVRPGARRVPRTDGLLDRAVGPTGIGLSSLSAGVRYDHRRGPRGASTGGRDPPALTRCCHLATWRIVAPTLHLRCTRTTSRGCSPGCRRPYLNRPVDARLI